MKRRASAGLGRAWSIGLRNLILGTNLASLPLLTRPNRLLGYVNENLFLLRTYGGGRKLEQRNVFEVFQTETAQAIVLGTLDRPAVVNGEPWFHPLASYAADVVSLCLLCRIVRPKTVFEIGTLRGYTTYHLALNTDADARIFTLDLPREGTITPALKTTPTDRWHLSGMRPREYCFTGSEAARRIRTLFGDSATFDYSEFHGAVDLFFIDGAHSYEYVRSDTEQALRCCRPGGVIAWHDYGRAGVNGVSRWLHELAATRQVYAVPGGSLAFMRVS
jgi:predicted O-methyltransferase YrrM